MKENEINYGINYWVLPGLPQNVFNVSMYRIMKTISTYYNIDVEVIKSKTRKREIVQCRHIFYYFSKRLTRHPLASIGDYSAKGWKGDHATAIHGIKAAKMLIETDKYYRNDVANIEKLIYNSEAEVTRW
jgi:chromosomal replication initiator protein